MVSAPLPLHVPVNPVRFVTAASLFDGHDAAINIMRRLLQEQGAEVVHLGHDRSVRDVADAVVQEDAAGVAISSYQGGHLEYFKYLVDELSHRGAGDVKIFGGGGGVIVPTEIESLAQLGVRIFSPTEGQRIGLPGMINILIRDCDNPVSDEPMSISLIQSGEARPLALTLSQLQEGRVPALAAALRELAAGLQVPVLGITGTGGSGKSSLTDELISRLRRDSGDHVRVAVLAIDPTRQRSGGALLGDRIRMNSLDPTVTFFRSVATRRPGRQLPHELPSMVAACKVAGYDLVILETPGIGQGDAEVVGHADVSLYVMTPEFGAASQLEKIEMLDLADVVAINKFERRGAEDAYRDVARQLQRNRHAFTTPREELPVFGTSAARFDDDGVTALYQHLRNRLSEIGLPEFEPRLVSVVTRTSTRLRSVLPRGREQYLADIAACVRAYHGETDRQAAVARQTAAVRTTAELVGDSALGAELAALAEATAGELSADTVAALASWPSIVAEYGNDEFRYPVRDQVVTAPLARTTLSGSRIPRVALPRDLDDGALVHFIRRENLPGAFPFTAGVFPFKRDNEMPARMFAGEGDPARTNRRFHLLAAGQPATRLSTAFDSVTLYGRDPALRPDVYGKVGTSGVSIATVDDMRDLYAGFDLCATDTSVSMTINGPAPTILAMFLQVAVAQQVAKFEADSGRAPSEGEAAVIRSRVLRTVRGTVQADILKEDQGQNTCIFSTDFALRCMADVQEWFIAHDVENFYSASISGYHIAEAGANPITQLAFTLANGFTYVEAYLARGMSIDDFAPSLSFFFSNGMDAEYTVIGRVARRIWAVAMRDRYGAAERSQKLKYHVQTSGRSLHAQEISFNDIRTTLQALCAVYDNANSLHTNAYDEAITTPSSESVRRALAIQLIIGHEWGLAANENPLQGSYVIEELTDLVEAAVLAEFDRIADRGGVLGAMETGYQRGRIQDESMVYEHRKHDGSLPIVGVNTFVDTEPPVEGAALLLARGTDVERRSQLERLARFHEEHAADAPDALAQLRQTATSGANIFDALLDAVTCCSLGQITDALFEVGGKYRRNV